MARHIAVTMAFTVALTIALHARGQGAAPPQSARTVTITDAVLAGGTPLPPGKYELRIAAAGRNPTQRDVEFVSNGAVIGRETAEIVPWAGTAGASAAAGRVRVEKLKDGDFVRVSFVESGERFLIYLPVAVP